MTCIGNKCKWFVHKSNENLDEKITKISFTWISSLELSINGIQFSFKWYLMTRVNIKTIFFSLFDQFPQHLLVVVSISTAWLPLSSPTWNHQLVADNMHEIAEASKLNGLLKSFQTLWYSKCVVKCNLHWI